MTPHGLDLNLCEARGGSACGPGDKAGKMVELQVVLPIDLTEPIKIGNEGDIIHSLHRRSAHVVEP